MHQDHTYSQKNKIINLTHKWHTQNLIPSPLNTIKYSQPFELILLHIIIPSIKCHKGSHYLYLLIN